MSDIGLIMNGLLGVLLVGALFLGWRLERRLKTLRASHQSFTRAVEDLDRAAQRAEQGLADLRAATDEAADSLAGRIERAGQLTMRLEKLTAEAVVAEARLATAPRLVTPAPAAQPIRLEQPLGGAGPAPQSVRPSQTREGAFARFAERYASKAAQSASVLAEAAARNDLILEDDEAPAAPTGPRVAPEVLARIERLRAFTRPQAGPAQSAARPVLLRSAEDELFDAPEPRRVAGGYR
jgi:hypothetical protein